MINKFNGVDGQKYLVDELLKQSVLRGFKGMAIMIAKVCTVEEYPAGSAIYREGDTSRYISLILSGRVSIMVGNKELALRTAGRYFGEMSLIDTAPRSASVIAIDNTVLANISEPDFTEIADNHPKLWRYLAHELADLIRVLNKR